MNFNIFDLNDDGNIDAEEKRVWRRRRAVAVFAVRIAGIAALASYSLYAAWDVMAVVMFMIGVAAIVSLATHYLRKLLFPYVNMERFAKEALKNPIAAAIVFASICMVISVILFVITNMVAPERAIPLQAQTTVAEQSK